MMAAREQAQANRLTKKLEENLSLLEERLGIRENKELVDIKHGELSLNTFDKLFGRYVPFTEVEAVHAGEAFD